MILCKLSDIMKKREIPYRQLERDTGISRSTLYLLAHQKSTAIGFGYTERLCKYLKVSVGDLFEYVPDEEKEDDRHV